MSDGADPTLETARRWWGLARFEPRAVDVEEIATALDPDGIDRSSEATERQVIAARALAEAVRDDPSPIVDDLEAWTSILGHEALGEPVARAVGAAGVEHDPALDHLRDRLQSATHTELHDVVAGLDRTAELDPGQVQPLTAALFEAGAAAIDTSRTSLTDRILGVISLDETGPTTDDPRRFRDATAGILGRVAVRDPALRSSLRESITAPDPGRRAFGALTIGMAVKLGCQALHDAADELVYLFEDAEPVREGAMRGLLAAVETYPGAAAGDDDLVLAYRERGALDGAAATVLSRVARADSSVFESLLNWVAEERSSDGFLSGLGWQSADRRAVDAIEASVEAHPGRFAAHERALDGMFEVDTGATARAVQTAGRVVPGDLGHAVEPLLDHSDATSHVRIQNPDATFGALATLARAHPTIPRRLVGRLSTHSGSRLDVSARACAAVAGLAPESLLSVTLDDELRAGPLLREQFRKRPKPGATRALARLGRADPSVVEPVADAVVDYLGDVRANRQPALYELAGTVARADPEATRGAGRETFEKIRGWAGKRSARTATAVGERPLSTAGMGLRNRTGSDATRIEEAVPFLAGLAVGRAAHADALVDLLERPDLREPVLAAVATAATDAADHFERHADSLVAVTTGRDPGVRRVATRTLATLAFEGSGTDERVTDRLRTLAYDPDPAVRQWATFGLGEFDDPGGETLDRLERVADDGDEAADPATVGLVRSGHRRAWNHLDTLETVAGDGDPPMGTAAVEALAATNSGGATDALTDALARADAPAVRDRIRTALGATPADRGAVDRPQS